MNDVTPVTDNRVPTGGSLGDTAAAYALLGWRIFPIVPGGKVPQFRRAHTDDNEQAACPGGHVCGRMGHGFKDATTDVTRIEKWWNRNPRCNIGIATGSPRGPGTSSPDVLDIDVKDGAPGLASLERLRSVGMLNNAFGLASTPSGGWHIFFDGSDQSSSTLKKHGVDFRSCGGYVVGPGSWVGIARNPRPYSWRWERFDLAKEGRIVWAEVRDFLAPPPLPRMTGPLFVDNAAPIIEWFRGQVAGNRNAALYWAACRILESGYDTSRLDDLAVSAAAMGLGDAEIRKTLNSATRKIIGGGV